MDVIDFPCDEGKRARMMHSLPSHFQQQILKAEAELRMNARNSSAAVKLAHALPTPAMSLIALTWHLVPALPASTRQPVLSTALSRIVCRSSGQQTFKGFATAGVRKSLQYALAKCAKHSASELKGACVR